MTYRSCEPTIWIWPEENNVRWWSPDATDVVSVDALPAIGNPGASECERLALSAVLPCLAVEKLGESCSRLKLDRCLPFSWQVFPWEWTLDLNGRSFAGRLLVERAVHWGDITERSMSSSFGDHWLVNLWPRSEGEQPFEGIGWVHHARKRIVADRILDRLLHDTPAALAIVTHGSEADSGPALLDENGQPWPLVVPTVTPKLVVLAACAGRHGNLIAEGMNWLGGGARTVLAPLGRLDAAATAEFLAALSQRLGAGETPGAILRSLQADPAQRHGAARFALLGEGGDWPRSADLVQELITLTRLGWRCGDTLEHPLCALRERRGLPEGYESTPAGLALLEELYAVQTELPSLVRCWVLALCAWLAEYHRHDRIEAITRARQALTDLESKLPAAPTLYALWAKAHYRQGDYQKAIDELVTALRLDAAHAGALGLLSNCLVDLDLPAAADRILRQLDATLSPNPYQRFKQHDMRARIAMRHGKLAAAAEHWRNKQRSGFADDGLRELASSVYCSAWRNAVDPDLLAQAERALEGITAGHGNNTGHYLLRALAACTLHDVDSDRARELTRHIERCWQASESERGPLAQAIGLLDARHREVLTEDAWECAESALESERYWLELAALHHLAGREHDADRALSEFQRRRKLAVRSLFESNLPSDLLAPEGIEAELQLRNKHERALLSAPSTPESLASSGLMPL